MNCIYCGTPLSGIDYCTGCGADVTLQKRIIRISNLLYNEGLEKATVRDLSGAIVCLKRSLKFNKENIAARNLLGLVYFETGEVVAALSEWVISKNMNVPDNAADLYIARLQANKNKLDAINQTIRKYNQALLYCRQDNEDMAIIQLKKVLAQNPKLIKAYHLLSLLYLKRQEYEKARKLLKKAAYIDATNTTTLRYLQEVEAATGISTSLDIKKKKKYVKEERVNHLNGTSTYMSGNEMIIQPTHLSGQFSSGHVSEHFSGTPSWSGHCMVSGSACYQTENLCRCKQTDHRRKFQNGSRSDQSTGAGRPDY